MVLLLLSGSTAALAQAQPDTKARSAEQGTTSYQGYADPTLRPGLLVFAGYGKVDLTNASAGVVPAVLARYGTLGYGATSATIDRLQPRSGTFGADFTLKYKGGAFGAAVGYRLQTASGPRLVTSADRDAPAPLHDAISSTLDIKASAISAGPMLNIGSNFTLEPTVDVDFWKVTTSTTSPLSGALSAGIVERTGHSASWGFRAIGYVSRSFGVGFEFHRLPIHDAAPADASAPWPAEIRAKQTFVALYYRIGS